MTQTMNHIYTGYLILCPPCIGFRRVISGNSQRFRRENFEESFLSYSSTKIMFIVFNAKIFNFFCSQMFVRPYYAFYTYCEVNFTMVVVVVMAMVMVVVVVMAMVMAVMMVMVVVMVMVMVAMVSFSNPFSCGWMQCVLRSVSSPHNWMCRRHTGMCAVAALIVLIINMELHIWHKYSSDI